LEPVRLTDWRILDELTEDLEKMTLFDQGWTEEHAKGLLDSLGLNGDVPHWKPEHLKKLQDWCADHGKDHKSIAGQLDFVAFELRNAHQDIGMALRRATTVEEARKAVEPYVKALREDPEWLLAFKPVKGKQR
jgi:Phage tail lysozyme